MDFMFTVFIWIFHTKSVRQTYLSLHHAVADIGRGFCFAALCNDSYSLTINHSKPVGISWIDS